MDADPRILPPHIEETIQSIAKLQASHNEQASPLQRSTDKLTAFVGQPQFLITITWTMFIWIGVNMGLKALALTPFDPPPFEWLQVILAVSALYITTLILATQRYADRLAGYREQLTLELRRRFKDEVVALSEYLDRDLVSLWGYDKLG